MDKKELRQHIKEKKKTFEETTLKVWSESLFQHIEKLPEFIAADTVFLYHSMKGEVYTHTFINKWYKEKNIILPVVKEDNLELRFFEGEDSLDLSDYGILEPVGKKLDDFRQIQLSLIPGIAFDKKKNRLGRGKGYYDRTLPLLNSYNVGICFDFQLVEKIPTDPFDQKMDCLCTENGLIH